MGETPDTKCQLSLPSIILPSGKSVQVNNKDPYFEELNGHMNIDASPEVALREHVDQPRS